MSVFSSAIQYAGAIIVGGVAGAVADNIIGLSKLWFFFTGWPAGMTSFAQAAIGSVLIVPLGWGIEWFTGFPAALVMMSAFTAMPNFRAALKSLVTTAAAPLNNEIDLGLSRL